MASIPADPWIDVEQSHAGTAARPEVGPPRRFRTLRIFGIGVACGCLVTIAFFHKEEAPAADHGTKFFAGVRHLPTKRAWPARAEFTPMMDARSKNGRQKPLQVTRAQMLGIVGALPASQIWSSSAHADDARITYMPGLEGKKYGKPEMDYSDFTRKDSLLYKDAKVGKGKSPEKGDRVKLDWSGYTIGYNGRPFETRKLRELDKIEENTLRFVVGDGKMIPGLNLGLEGMQEGGVRQLVVPGDREDKNLGYPNYDFSHDLMGPKPCTFSGMQALNFVLQNKGMIDRTLLFNIKLLRVDKSDGRGGFITGGKKRVSSS